MDSTPDKNTHPSPSFLNNFEDSPVFNYISTLSPIRQFRLGHSAESINLLSFPSPQSLQTPQSTGCAKEPTHTRASNVTEVSINNCSQNGSEGRTVGTSDAVQPADLHIDEVEKLDSGEEMTVCATEESPKPVTEHPKPLKHECVNPENHVVHCGAVKQECDNDVGGIGILFPAKVIQDVSKEAEGSFETEIGFQGIQVDDNKDVSEWENFMHEASDILNCHSPTEENNCEELDDKTEDSESFITAALQPPTENFDETQKVESVCPIVSTENHRGTGQPDEKNQVPAGNARALLSEEVVSYIRTETNEKSKPSSGCKMASASSVSSSLQQQTTSRRCLVYEMSGTHYRKLLSDPDSGTPIFNPAVCPDTAKENCLAANRPGNNRCSSLLPGIGLHLNALAAASRDKIIVKRQTLTCRRQLISLPSTISSFDSSTPDTKPPTTSLVPELTEKDCVQRNMSCFNSLASDTKAHNVPVAPMFVEGGCDEQKDGAQVTGNACENFTFDESVEILQSSPKKKRKRSDNVGEAGSCKRCNCKRSKCLKLYCECFAAGLYCVEPCNCQDCFNKPAHEETVLETRRQIESRNPLAFAPKVIRCSGSPNHGDELNKTPSSARHKRGCNCKKSGCLKKYCECFQGGVGCSLSCRCEGCKNTFGQKEGTLFEEAKILRMCAVDAVSQSDDDNQATEPCNITRQPVRRPFHFGSIAQQFSSSSGEPYLQSCTTEKTENLDQTAYEEDLKIAPDDEAPEISQGDYLLPTTCVKSTSPNCKRISPALRDFETSPGWKSCRKLILRSISAFPTVTQDNESTELQEKLQ